MSPKGGVGRGLGLRSPRWPINSLLTKLQFFFIFIFGAAYNFNRFSSYVVLPFFILPLIVNKKIIKILLRIQNMMFSININHFHLFLRILKNIII